jgi:hypothetical protein
MQNAVLPKLLMTRLERCETRHSRSGTLRRQLIAIALRLRRTVRLICYRAEYLLVGLVVSRLLNK